MRALESCPPLFVVRKARRHLPQVEFPGFLPLARRAVRELRADFHFVQVQYLVFRAVGREGENRGIEFNLALTIFDFLDPAHSQGLVNTVQAFDMGTETNRRALLRCRCFHALDYIS